MNISDLETALDPSEIETPITPAEAVFEGEENSDAGAVAILLKNWDDAETWQGSRNLPQEWQDADRLYAAYIPRMTWPGTNTERASVRMPLVMDLTNDVTTDIYQTFMSGAVPFLVGPKAGTSSDAARAQQYLLNYELERNEFAAEWKKLIQSFCLYGMGAGVVGWTKKTVRRKVFKRAAPSVSVNAGLETQVLQTKKSSKLVAEWVEEEVNVPYFDQVSLRDLKWDPLLKDSRINKGRFVIRRLLMSAQDLDDLRDNPNYQNIPSREELVKLTVPSKEPAESQLNQANGTPFPFNPHAAETSYTELGGNPLQSEWEVLECYEDGRVTAVLQRQVCIRNQVTEGPIPFFSACFVEAPESCLGFGTAHIIGDEQRIQQALYSSYIDGEALVICPMFEQDPKITASENQYQTPVFPGAVLRPGLKAVTVPDHTQSANLTIEASTARAQSRIGAGVPTQAFRTGTGVSSVDSKQDAKTQMLVDTLTNNIFIPMLEEFHRLNCEFLGPDELAKILGPMAKAFEGDVTDIYNGQYKYDILAGSRLLKRTAALQKLPLIANLLSAPAFQQSLDNQNLKINYVGFLQDFLDSDGLNPSTYIQPKTPEEIEQYKSQQQQALQIAAMRQQQEQQAQQANIEEIQEKGIVQSGRDVLKAQLKASEGL